MPTCDQRLRHRKVVLQSNCRQHSRGATHLRHLRVGEIQLIRFVEPSHKSFKLVIVIVLSFVL